MNCEIFHIILVFQCANKRGVKLILTSRGQRTVVSFLCPYSQVPWRGNMLKSTVWQLTTDVDRVNSKMYIFGVHTLRDMSARVYTTSHRTPFGQRNVISFLLATRFTSGILIMCKPWHFTLYGQQKRFQLRLNMTTLYRRGEKRSRLDCFHRRIAKKEVHLVPWHPKFLEN